MIKICEICNKNLMLIINQEYIVMTPVENLQEQIMEQENIKKNIEEKYEITSYKTIRWEMFNLWI